MLRFRDLLLGQLKSAGYKTVSLSPESRFGELVKTGSWAKWLGYIDKYIIFPLALLRHVSSIKDEFIGRKVVVHICDHSNAVYVTKLRRWFPVLVTCHDLLAVRGALGEDTDCPASGFGKRLQAEILNGLSHANFVACVSRSTQSDLIRLAGLPMAQRSQVIPLALNFEYRELTRDEAMAVLAREKLDLSWRGFILHVGSALRRKNREALIHSVAQIKDAWPGQIVFAGEPLTEKERSLAQSLGLWDRVREIVGPSNETLRALYSAAHCFVFMSRFEGFGWPILEAQMSGCPVICSDRTSVPEVAGEGALIHDAEDFAAVARDIQRLQDPAFRETVVAQGLKNAQSFSAGRMMQAYEDLYRRI